MLRERAKRERRAYRVRAADIESRRHECRRCIPRNHVAVAPAAGDMQHLTLIDAGDMRYIILGRTNMKNEYETISRTETGVGAVRKKRDATDGARLLMAEKSR